MIRARLGAAKDLVTVGKIPDRMTLVKRPTLDRMTTLLRVEPKVSLEQGVDLVCRRIRERIREGERGSEDR